MFYLLDGTKEMISEKFIGFYIHGSLAMGGFNPKSSDIDVLVVTNSLLAINIKVELAQFFLINSNNPFPVEISFMNGEQLEDWKHPSLFDFHYSENWRERYEKDLSNGTSLYINDKQIQDADLAAHITITKHRGICLEGSPINNVFPSIPRSDYITSIMCDFEDCLEDIERNPIYCTLNLIRVYWYLKEGIISSKQEAGNWGLSSLPKDLNSTIQKVISGYDSIDFDKKELQKFKDYIYRNVQMLL
ncbi:DUF4111 domain-containing protein [Mesobacillus zeae]|uniref:Spectinomycin 9-adenylyltransferase n=3 Tax=Mesobacillus zeae TaxID=1917180 RepID=A0A398AXA4_9BACI|nr:DUF4111 domain-containing protein [Mesobacillus zeae]